MIVFQATNRYVDLAPVIQRLAAEQGMEARLISDWPDDKGGDGYWLSATDQVLVTRDARLLQHRRVLEASGRIAERFDLPPSSDARHNLFRILKWRKHFTAARHVPFGGIVYTAYVFGGRERTMKQRTAKLFKNGSSQAVRLPAEFRFAGDEVRIRRNPETGDVVLSPITAGWDEFCAQRERTPERRNFLARRRDRAPQERELF